MTLFVQLHLLTSYPAANLNREDTGRPKTLVYGGAERVRISSQSLKRAIRTSSAFAAGVGSAIGVRSQRFALALVEALEARGLPRAEAVSRVEAVIEHDRLGKVARGKAQTQQLVQLGPDELANLHALADRLATADTLSEKGMLVLTNPPRAADIAMFGRMLADNPRYNVEAAVQVAHAFSTHRAVVEDDFFTAIDDLAGVDGGLGAPYVGLAQFAAGTFYSYVCVDTALLRDNLAGDVELCADALAALVLAAMTVSPRGRQSAFASRARASYALLEVGTEAPRTLASAFQHPVGEREGEDDQLATSIRRLRAQKADFGRAYGEIFATVTEFDVSDPNAAALAQLLAAARGPFEAPA